MKNVLDLNSQLAFFHQNFQQNPEKDENAEEEPKEKFSDYLRNSVKNLIKQEFKEEISDQLDALKKNRFKFFKRQLLANKSDIQGKISMNNSLISEKDKSSLLSHKSAEKLKYIHPKGRSQRLTALREQVGNIGANMINFSEINFNAKPTDFDSGKINKTINVDNSQLSSTVDETKLHLSVETSADLSYSVDQGRKLFETNETILSDNTKQGLPLNMQLPRKKSNFKLLSLISPVHRDNEGGQANKISFKEEEKEMNSRITVAKKEEVAHENEWKCNKIMAVIERRKEQMLYKLQKDHLHYESILNKVRQVSLETKHEETRASFVIYDYFNRFTGFKIILMELPIYKVNVHGQKLRDDYNNWLEEAQKKLELPHGLNFIFFINEKIAQDLSVIPEKCNLLLVSSTPRSFFWKEVFKYHNLRKDNKEKFLDEELEHVYDKISVITKPKELVNFLLSRDSVSNLFEKGKDSLYNSEKNILVNESAESSSSDEENKDNKNWKLQKEIGSIINSLDDEFIEKQEFFDEKGEEEEKAFYQDYIEGVYQSYEDSVGFTRDVRMKYEKKNQTFESLQTKYYVFDNDEITKNEKFAVGKSFEKILAQEIKRVENEKALELKRRSFKHKLYLEETRRLKLKSKGNRVIHENEKEPEQNVDHEVGDSRKSHKNWPVDIIKRNKDKIMKEKDRVTDKINKNYHLLFHRNIPMIQGEHEFTRQEIHVFFSRFKAMLHYCYELNKKLKGQKGIDITTFRKVMMEYFELPHKQLLNGLYSLNENTKPVEWEHFLSLMKTLNSSSIDNKIDIFLQSIKIDTNGYISAEEITELAKNSISTIIKDQKDAEIIEILADALCKIVIRMYCEENNVELPYEKLSQKSFKGEEEEEDEEKADGEQEDKEEGQGQPAIRIPVASLKKLMKPDNKDVEYLLLLFCLKEEDLKGEKHEEFYKKIVDLERKKTKQKEFEFNQKAKKYLEKNFIQGMSQEDQSKLISTWEKRLSMALDKFRKHELGEGNELFPGEGDYNVENGSRIKDLIKIRRKSMLQNLGSFSNLNDLEKSPKVFLRDNRSKV